MKTRRAAVGGFVLAGLLLFGLGLFLIGDRKRLFEDSFVVHAEFARLAGLTNGARVRVAGLSAGEVLSISYPRTPRAKFRVRMRVIEDLHPLVRTDSVALIQTEGLVGEKLVEIGEGSPEAPPVEDEGSIVGREPFEIADLLAKASDTADELSDTVILLRDKLDTTIESVESAVGKADDLIGSVDDDVKSITASSRAVAGNISSIVADVRAGKGTLGKLVNDEELHGEVKRIVDRMENVSADAEAAFENVKELTHEAKEALNRLEPGRDLQPGLLADLKQTLSSAREAASDLAENTESMKRSFLFRGLFLDRGFFDLDTMTPQQYVEGGLGDLHRSRRILIAADDLVQTTDDGKEALSEEGRARIHSAMREILRYPPNAPLMVEGYADSGSLDERYRVARNRAFLVRDYVVTEFHRDPNYTGFVALDSVALDELDNGDDDPTLTGEGGVVLALYYDADPGPSPRQRLVR